MGTERDNHVDAQDVEQSFKLILTPEIVDDCLSVIEGCMKDGRIAWGPLVWPTWRQMYPNLTEQQCLYIKNRFRNKKAAAKKREECRLDDGVSLIADSSEPTSPSVPADPGGLQAQMNDQGTTDPFTSVLIDYGRCQHSSGCLGLVRSSQWSHSCLR